jgi:molecular chaperone HtpG
MALNLSPQPPREPESTEELLYAAVVQILSEDLYPRKLEIIREYIQNASDAIDDWLRIAHLIPNEPSEPEIKISIQQRSLLIFDGGTGMTGDDIPKLMRIAYSEKKAGEEAGYKGIGRLAGIAVAEKLKISSTSYGDPKLHHFEFRAGDMRRDVSEKKKQGIQEPASPVIKRHSEMWWTDVDPADHYTLVELRDIKQSCGELLDPDKIAEFVGDIGPVPFSPELSAAERLTDKLSRNVPDYSPKTIFLSRPDGTKTRVYKPYADAMALAEPEFIEVPDPKEPSRLLAFCWYTANAETIIGKVRPTGKIFTVPGDSLEERRRFAGLVYKLFGFSIGDRSLPERTIWTTAKARAPWFTGEIHIVDKNVMPTTDRSNFVPNAQREALYKECADRIVDRLKNYAQEISDNRKTYQDAARLKTQLDTYQKRLDSGDIERSDLKVIREDLDKRLGVLRARGQKCTDKEIEKFQRDVQRTAATLQADLANPKKLRTGRSIADIAEELQMPSKARKVLLITMDVLQQHFARDKDEYYQIATKIYKALKEKY